MQQTTAAKTPSTELTSSLEDYLETVLELVRNGHVARVKDIAKAMGVGMPSVTVALKALAKRGLVNYDPYQFVTLTPLGEKLGKAIDNRHKVLRNFLVNVLGVSEAAAQENACRIEHAIDESVLSRLGEFAKFTEEFPQLIQKWQEHLKQLQKTK